ncbi:hypothetical protein DM01DRAFT_1289088 [Hesseltinella vesiculosa]|uniref:Cyclin N-terminal domain-containing protein n=1 Tax=Hesseltinella vesiculosa TaxID=101127 RepID=A0A1X2GFP3_9FUNG|nr:hypothetical protein DM01DRAFT_1289088 [Hesseltinella vesiculosa]
MNQPKDKDKKPEDDQLSASDYPGYRPLPSILVDFFALTMCDFLPTKPIQERTTPELIYFIQKITCHARVSCHIAVVALIYIDRCKEALPKNAVGDQDTAHRTVLAALLVASKFLHGTRWASSQLTDECTDKADEDRQYWLTNRRLSTLLRSMYTLQQINQLERSFLSVIDYKCWVDSCQVQDYLIRHRQELML